MAFLPTNASQVQAFAGALYGIQVGTATLTQVNADILAAGGLNNALNGYYTASFGSKTTASVASTLVANLGLTGQAATDAAAYVKGQLDAAPAASRGVVTQSILNLFAGLSSDATYGAAATAWNAKVAAAAAYSGATDVAIGTVVATAAFALTTGNDTPALSSGNDTINGTVTIESTNGTATSASTFNSGDQIDALAGNDTLNIVVDGALKGSVANSMVIASVAGVETVNIRGIATMLGTSAISVDAANFPGVTSIGTDRSTDTINISNIPATARATMTGNGGVSLGAFNPGWKSTVTAAILDVANGTGSSTGAVTATGSAVTSFTINSTGAANTLGGVAIPATSTSLTVNAAAPIATGNVTGFTGTTATITVAGAAANIAATAAAHEKGAVNLGTIENTTVKTIDATGLTAGGVELTANSNTALSVKGGQGNDFITTGAALTTGSVDAGAGTDTLIVGSASHINTSALGAKYTNFEILRVADTMDVSLVPGIVALEVPALTAKSLTNVSAKQAADITVQATQTTSLTLGLADTSGSADSVTLKLKSDTATTDVDVPGLSVAGVETLNIVGSSGTSTSSSDVDLASGGADKLTKVVLTGTVPVGFTATNSAKAITVDGTGASKITIAGDFVKGSVINGGAGKDSLTVGATANTGSTYNGGAGDDAFSTDAAFLAADGTLDHYLNGGDGVDTLTLTGTQTVTDNEFTNVTGMEKLATAATTAISYTSLGAGFKQAFADGVTITSGTLQDGATYTLGAGLYNKAMNVTLVSSGDGVSTADNVTLTTGTGDDVVSVTASSWVGTTASTGGVMTISTGAGNDTITLTTGTLTGSTQGSAAVTVNGGAGKDTINLTGTNASAVNGGVVTIAVGSGQSTTDAYDSVIGFDISNGTQVSSKLDVAQSVSLTTYSATAATGFALADLAVAVSNVGLVTFSGTSAAGASLATKIAAVQSVVTTNNGDMAMFTYGGNTYVFQNDTSGDTLVELIGVTGSSLVTTNVTTSGAIFVG